MAANAHPRSSLRGPHSVPIKNKYSTNRVRFTGIVRLTPTIRRLACVPLKAAFCHRWQWFKAIRGGGVHKCQGHADGENCSQHERFKDGNFLHGFTPAFRLLMNIWSALHPFANHDFCQVEREIVRVDFARINKWWSP